VTNITDRGGGYGGGWGESQDEFKRRVMGKKEAFLWIASSIAFVVLSVDQINKNQQIQSRASQQQQPSAQITKATIDSGFNRVEDFLEQPLVACVIQDLAQTFIGNHKPSDGWQCALDALQNRSRSYQ
jgi:heme exporter protein D